MNKVCLEKGHVNKRGGHVHGLRGTAFIGDNQNLDAMFKLRQIVADRLTMFSSNTASKSSIAVLVIGYESKSVP